MKVRVAITGDETLLRTSIAELLRSFRDLAVVGEAGTDAEATALARDQRPDVMLLDLDGSTAARAGEDRARTAVAIRAASPRTRIVALSTYDDPMLLRSLLRAGVTGFLMKSVGRAELHATILAATRGDDAVTIRITPRTAAALSAGLEDDPKPLTARELEVIRALAAGGSNQHIARDLQLAEATVKRHLATIYRKLDARSRLQAVNKAQALGLI